MMTKVHCYIGVENLGLNEAQCSTLVTALQALGPGSNPQPAKINHWRVRLDGDAIILEALFDENSLTVPVFKQRLATIFGVQADDIKYTMHSTSFDGGTTLVVTFSYNSVERLQFALFGGSGASWQESGNECRGYLKLYQDEWEPPEE